MTKRFLGALAMAGIMSMYAVAGRALAGDWPRFRGGDGCGITDEKNLPTQWDGKTGKNVFWKEELPKGDAAISSPIVVGDKVIVTYAVGGGNPEQHVICFVKADGSKLWDTVVDLGPLKNVDGRGGFAGPTPCSDGKHVFAVFASGVIAALDMDGKLAWRHDLPNSKFDVVMGNSPVLFGDTVILINDQHDKKSQLLAWYKADGHVKLDVPRPGCDFAHSTPILVKVGGQEELIAAASSQLQGIDPGSGNVLWFAKVHGETASPVCDGGLVYTDTGRGDAGVAVAPGGEGDVTGQAVKATFKNHSDLGSGVVLGEYVDRQAGDNLQCSKLATGETVYTKPVKGASNWASPIASRAGFIYVGNSGTCHVFKAGPEGEEISANNLGDGSAASAAVSDGKIFFRGTKYLWCIGDNGKN